MSWAPCSGHTNNETILFVPPFAEEMNKSRRMMSEQSRRLAALGYHVLLVDLFGTGESEGSFVDAGWNLWLDDLARCCDWLREKAIGDLSIVTMRSGALLAAELASKRDIHVKCLLMWQPVVNGDSFLTQFLRLKLAGDMTKASSRHSSVKSLKTLLNEEETVEVAGYMLPPSVANEMAKKNLKDSLPCCQSRVVWVNILADASRDVPLITRKTVEELQKKGCSITFEKVEGAAFWTATEVVEIEALFDLTAQVLTGR